MRSWFETIWSIVLLRAGPQDLPGGVGSALLGVLCFGLILVVSGQLEDQPTDAVDLIVSLGVPLLAVAVLLQLRGHPGRLYQTAAALFGSGALISLVNVPLWLFPGTPVPAPIVLLVMLGLFWSLAVDGHIWRHALDFPYPLGVAIAVLIVIVQASLFQFLSGGIQ